MGVPRTMSAITRSRGASSCRSSRSSCRWTARSREDQPPTWGTGEREADRLGTVFRLRLRGDAGHRRVAGVTRQGPTRGQLPPPRRLLSRQRYWAARSHRYCEKWGGMLPSRRRTCPSCSEVEEYLPKGRSPLAAAEDWVNMTCPRWADQRIARRTRWTPSSTRPGTHPLRRSAQRPGAVRPPHRGLMAAGQPVHRRDRACDPPSALRALLHEGDERPRARRLP